MTARKMSPAQSAYLAVKFQADLLQDEKTARMTALFPDGQEPDIDALVDADMRIEAELGIRQADDALRQAETALLEWSREQVAKLPAYRPVAEQIEKVLTCRLPSIRPKVIDAAMRLAA